MSYATKTSVPVDQSQSEIKKILGKAETGLMMFQTFLKGLFFLSVFLISVSCLAFLITAIAEDKPKYLYGCIPGLLLNSYFVGKSYEDGAFSP